MSLESEILSLVRTQLHCNTLTVDDDLVSHGMDSLAMVRILIAIEKVHEIWLDGESLDPRHFKSVVTLAAEVERRKQA